jgi:hypothetical protein
MPFIESFFDSIILAIYTRNAPYPTLNEWLFNVNSISYDNPIILAIISVYSNIEEMYSSENEFELKTLLNTASALLWSRLFHWYTLIILRMSLYTLQLNRRSLIPSLYIYRLNSTNSTIFYLWIPYGMILCPNWVSKGHSSSSSSSSSARIYLNITPPYFSMTVSR